MLTIRSRKIALFFFGLSEASASLLTCRRRAADTPQTLTQTLPQTLLDQEGRRERFFEQVCRNYPCMKI